MKTFVLNSTDLKRVVAATGIDSLMDQMIYRLKQAFISYDPKSLETPQRSGFNYQNPIGLVEWMPIHQVGEKVTIKVVGYHPTSPARFDLPTIVSTLSSYDTKTGHLEAMVDATFLTSVRTGAASAIASQWLADPASKVLGIVGCGAQAVTQIHAISRCFDLEEVLIFDTDESSAISLRNRVSFLNDSVEVSVAQLDEIARRSDILCAATSVEPGAGPVVDLSMSKSSLHVNAVGSDFPGKTELSVDFLKRSFVCPDFSPQAAVEGECQQLAPSEFAVTITDIAKQASDYVEQQKMTTVFDSTGWALEDWVAMELIVEKAQELGVGEQIEIECLSKDPLDPYEFLDFRDDPDPDSQEFSSTAASD